MKFLWIALASAGTVVLTQEPVAPPAPAPVQTAPTQQDSEQVKRRLAEVQGRLRSVEAQLEALKRRRKGVLVELQAIALNADRFRAQADAARLKRDQIQLEVDAISAKKEQIQQEMERLRGELRKQVRWMQAKGPLGDLTFLAGLSSFEQYVSQGRYLVYLRNRERERMARIQSLQADLTQRERDLQTALRDLAQAEQTAIQSQAGLQLHEDRLKQFRDELDKDENRQREMQAELAEEALQLERMLTQLLGRPQPNAFETHNLFTALRGQLPQPTPGTLVQTFGEHLNPMFKTRTIQSGLLIDAVQGSPVLAVADSRVVFADIYQSFGPMVILDHGEGYYSIYTHLEAVTVTKGQILKQGEPVGSVGLTLDGPRLGFEIRHLTQPEDPNKWLKVRYR